MLPFRETTLLGHEFLVAGTWRGLDSFGGGLSLVEGESRALTALSLTSQTTGTGQPWISHCRSKGRWSKDRE